MELITPVELSKEVGCKSQMVYNYIKQGLIESVEVELTNDEYGISITKKYITREAADKYIQKRAERQAKKDAKVTEEMNGTK